MIPPAQATGRFTLICNVMAREIVVDKAGRAQAVSYIDKATKQEIRSMPKRLWWQRAPANRRASLLNSRSTVFPDGLANSSGAVGHYLMDSVGSDAFGYFPQLQMFPPAQP